MLGLGKRRDVRTVYRSPSGALHAIRLCFLRRVCSEDVFGESPSPRRDHRVGATPDSLDHGCRA